MKRVYNRIKSASFSKRESINDSVVNDPQLCQSQSTNQTINTANQLSISTIDLSGNVLSVLNQGQQGTCLDNCTQAAFTYFAHANKLIENDDPENVISRFCLQFKYNAATNQLNPNNMKLRIFKEGVEGDSNYTGLYQNGSTFSGCMLALVNGIITESIWKYVPPYVTEYCNLNNPYVKYNPLLKHDYNPCDNKFYTNGITIYSINYGTTSYENLKQYRDNNCVPFLNTALYQLYIQWYYGIESVGIIVDDTLIQREINYINLLYNSLKLNKPVMCSFAVPAAFENLDNSGLLITPFRIPLEDMIIEEGFPAGHASLLIGIIKGSDLLIHYQQEGVSSPLIEQVKPNAYYMKFLNSWGASFGDKGYWYYQLIYFLNAEIVDDGISLGTLFSPCGFVFDDIYVAEKCVKH